jgi:hypothetical protein
VVSRPSREVGVAALSEAVLNTPSAGAGFGPPMRAPLLPYPGEFSNLQASISAQTHGTTGLDIEKKRKNILHKKD